MSDEKRFWKADGETKERERGSARGRERRLHRETERTWRRVDKRGDKRALRSKEHACDAALENVVKRNGDGMTKGTEL